MWSRIAEEMAIPWRAAEAMHWQMGEHEMARRAGVTPFTLANTNNLAQHPNAPTISVRHRFPPHMQMPASIPASLATFDHHRRNSGPALSQSGQPQQLPSLAELTAGLPAFAPSSYPPSHQAPSSVGSPYSEYPGRRSLPPAGPHTGTAFDHLPPPGALNTGRPTTPSPGQPAVAANGYFSRSDLNGNRY
jgi:hypothetical protein